MNAPPKVADLEFTVDSDEKIFGLNVPVDYVLGVQVNESIGHLIDVNGTPAFGEAAVLHELFVHLTLASEFKHEEDAVLVVKITVETKDIGVPKVLLNLDFTTDLFLNPRFHNLLLVETLEGEDVVGFGLRPNHIDVPKPAFPQRTTYVKVIKVPVTGWSLPAKVMRTG